MVQLVLFDCDGVLFDSVRSNVAYYNAVLEAIGEPPLDEETERLCHVYSTPQLFAALYRDDPDKARRAIRVAAEIDYLPYLDYLDPAPGLYQVLETLKASYRLGLATNRGVSLPPLLERFGLDRLFDVVASILDVERPKPAPDMLLYCLERTGTAPGDAVYVGDMENDLAAASAAGIPFILMGDGFDHPVRIHRLEELPPLLEKGVPPVPARPGSVSPGSGGAEEGSEPGGD